MPGEQQNNNTTPNLKPKLSAEYQVLWIMLVASAIALPAVLIPGVVSNYLEDRKARVREHDYRLIKGI